MPSLLLQSLEVSNYSVHLILINWAHITSTRLNRKLGKLQTFCCLPRWQLYISAIFNYMNLYLTFKRCHHTFDEVGVVATLSQLHHSVDQIGHVWLASAFSQEREVFLQDGAVVFLLNIGELNLDDGFLFRSQLLLHILLQPPQHHGLQDSLKLLHLWTGKRRRYIVMTLSKCCWKHCTGVELHMIRSDWN